MARATTSYVQDYGSVTQYKNYYQPLSTILNTVLNRTTDTGQVNWGTIPSEPTVVRDYEIFSLGGPLAGSAPLYLRVDYLGNNFGGLSVATGTSTNGAGVLGGLTVATQKLHQMNISGPYTLYAWAASDGESYVTFSYALDPAASGLDGVGTFVIERSRDIDGTANAAGYHVWRWQAISGGSTTYLGAWSRVYAAQTQPVVQDWNVNVFVPDLQNVGGAFRGTTSYAFPTTTYAGITPGGASKALMFAFAPDFPRGTPVTVTHYGQQMSFLPFADSVVVQTPTMTALNTPGGKNLSPLIRWD